MYSFTTSKNRTYYLHKRDGKNGTPLYFFAKEVGEGAVAEVPQGRKVIESRTGMPVLAKA